MQYFIGRLAVSEGFSGVQQLDQALFVANDKDHAQSLNETRAKTWGWGEGVAIPEGAWQFNSKESGNFIVRAYGVLEISQTTFHELKDWFPVIGNAPAPAVTEPEEPWLPSGEWPTAALRDISDIDFIARVNAVWLTHGDVKLAAKLLHVDAEALMTSFKSAPEADTAFCGRPIKWLPEDSLAPNLSGAAMRKSANGYDTYRTLSLGYASFSIEGSIGNNQVFEVSNADKKDTPVFKWTMKALPTSLFEVGLLAACLNDAIRLTYAELSSDWSPHNTKG